MATAPQPRERRASDRIRPVARRVRARGPCGADAPVGPSMEIGAASSTAGRPADLDLQSQICDLKSDGPRARESLQSLVRESLRSLVRESLQSLVRESLLAPLGRRIRSLFLIAGWESRVGGGRDGNLGPAVFFCGAEIGISAQRAFFAGPRWESRPSGLQSQISNFKSRGPLGGPCRAHFFQLAISSSVPSLPSGPMLQRS